MSSDSAAPRAILVDGYNLLHAIPRFAPRGGPIEPARAALEGWLAEAARARGVGEVVVIWDGRAAGREARAPSPLTILYTPASRTADDRILDLCRGRYAARSAHTWVVSSDHGVQRPARQLGFEAIGAMTFYRRWTAERRKPRRGPAGPVEAPDKPRRASRREVDELLDEFLGKLGEEE